MTQATKPQFVLEMERVVDAPRERVWKAWAEPEQIKRWFAPRPYQLLVGSMDLRAGGRFAMTMKGPNGESHDFGGVYQVVEAPSRLVWTGEFPGDPKDNIRTEVRFEAQGAKTKLYVRQTFEKITPINEQPTKGAKMGWTMTLDQLAAFVLEKA